MQTNARRHGFVAEAGAAEAGALEGAAEDAEAGDASFPELLGFAEEALELEADAEAGDELAEVLADADAGALALAPAVEAEGAALSDAFGAADDVLGDGAALVV